MTFRRLPPRPELRDAVESLWIQESDASPQERTPSWVLPTGTVELLFHYGDPFVHLESGEPQPVPRSYITGQRTRPVLAAGTGRVGIVLVSLHPWGAEALLPGTASIVDGYTDLASILSPWSVAQLEERLVAATCHEDRLAWVQDFLLGLRATRAGDERIVGVSRWLARGGLAPIPVLARGVGMSPRHFSRSFRAAVGLGPKGFSRVMRFQRALGLHRAGRGGWAEIAGACGYADQAHLIREVREFTARTPAALPAARRSPDQYFNGAGVSEYFDTVYL